MYTSSCLRIHAASWHVYIAGAIDVEKFVVNDRSHLWLRFRFNVYRHDFPSLSGGNIWFAYRTYTFTSETTSKDVLEPSSLRLC